MQEQKTVEQTPSSGPQNTVKDKPKNIIIPTDFYEELHEYMKKRPFEEVAGIMFKFSLAKYAEIKDAV